METWKTFCENHHVASRDTFKLTMSRYATNWSTSQVNVPSRYATANEDSVAIVELRGKIGTRQSSLQPAKSFSVFSL
ncbi:hypothetical protein E3N88_27481 [Mikania micrantha]|uniref:Uncharacterized protein n=1 Tax=Mikania micrantha TaxID=192012 RepID=A0A5N6MXW3_9ASTR|nr:hypothetical protein E3N88_27481 [Mikania micrantha]